MCTVVVLVRPDHAWPVVLVANRDESVDRAWDPPAAWWAEYAGVIAGRDRTAGGTWMGVNAHGVTAAVLNRPGSLGPAAGKRSRGELPLLALAERSAAAAVEVITKLDSGNWRGFNLVIADRGGATFIRGAGYGNPTAHALPPGVSMITAHDPNDLESPRVVRHLVRFRNATAPEPGPGRDAGHATDAVGRPGRGEMSHQGNSEQSDAVRWDAWRAILADRSGSAGEQINVEPRGGFGTVCSSFLAIRDVGEPVWLFAAGAPHEAPFERVDLRSGAAPGAAHF